MSKENKQLFKKKLLLALIVSFVVVVLRCLRLGEDFLLLLFLYGFIGMIGITFMLFLAVVLSFFFEGEDSVKAFAISWGLLLGSILLAIKAWQIAL
jgi:hypothetical protein